MHEQTTEILSTEQIHDAMAATGKSPAEIARALEQLKHGEHPEVVSIPAEQFAAVQRMNRHQRREWAAKERARLRAAAKKGAARG